MISVCMMRLWRRSTPAAGRCDEFAVSLSARRTVPGHPHCMSVCLFISLLCLLCGIEIVVLCSLLLSVWSLLTLCCALLSVCLSVCLCL